MITILMMFFMLTAFYVMLTVFMLSLESAYCMPPANFSFTANCLLHAAYYLNV